MNRRLRLMTAMALMLAAATPARPADTPPAPSRSARLPGLAQLSLAPLVEEVTPAVVNIAAVHPSPQLQNPLLRDPYFRRFFGVPDAAVRPRLSAGSGVIVDARRGLVLTNHHVIQNAQQVQVTLKDRRSFAAEVVGSDPLTDIAVLRIPAKNLVALPLGDADRLRVGDYVVAVGNPFGIGQTVTAGIVSALERSGLSPEGYESYIQTDAPINPGNSGGALVNLAGELVGINSAILAPTGGNVGIGFAVPTNIARTVMDQILQYGTVRRGWVGIAVQDLTPDLLAALGDASPREGAVVTAIASGSPAATAGIRQGDIVVGFNDRPVSTASALRNMMGLTPIGSEVRLEIVRQGKTQTVRLHNIACPPRGCMAQTASLEGDRRQAML